jgi:hypothetical protein
MGNIGSQNDLTSGRCGQQAKEPYGRCRAGICFASSYWGPSERSIHISGICCKVQQLYSLVHSTSSVRFLPFDICQNVAAYSIRAQDFVISGTACKSAVLRSNKDDAWNEYRIRIREDRRNR